MIGIEYYLTKSADGIYLFCIGVAVYYILLGIAKVINAIKSNNKEKK